MGLHSRAFRGDQKLEACLISDPAHLTPGTTGEHVAKVQAALLILDGAQIDQQDLLKKTYGSSTAAAVLAYKKKRRIINPAYQTKADNIVGKMTIATLDREMLAFERSLRELNTCSGKRTPLITR